ncbi:MAG: hypothetical protein IT323_22730 [Anaerolineae bacterium]|nr:hypothetical protein [Anaerolineae bacterium]
MVAITYNAYVDLNLDGDFVDTSEDISAYVKRVSIKRGVSKTFDTIARDTTIELVLDNADKLFSPDATGGLSGLKPGAQVKVTMTYGGTTVTLGIGRIARDGIQVQQGTKLTREATLRTFGYLRMLQEERTVILSLMTNVRTDAVISALISAIGLYPLSSGGWKLGSAGFSELGETTVLGADAGSYASLQTGDNLMAYVGDVWGEETSAYAMMRDLMEAERGLLFEARDGVLTMLNRSFFLTDVSTAVDATMTGANLIARKKQDYRYGQDVINDVTVTGYPRQVGAARTVVARLYAYAGTGHIVPAQTTRTITLNYQTADGIEIGAYSILCDVTTDYTLAFWNSVTQQIEAGSPSVGLTILEGAGLVQLVFNNADAQHAIIMAGATETNNVTVRGYAVQSFDGVTANAVDTASIGQAMRQAARFDLKLLTDADAPQDMANFELYNRSDVRGGFAAITLLAQTSATQAAWARDLTIGSRIALSETQTGTNREYFIVGEEHNIINAGYEHYVTYTLRPVHDDYWILGVTGFGELDSIRLGY